MKYDRSPRESVPAKPQRAVLGRGLSALLPGSGSTSTTAVRGLLTVALEEVSPERDQPRRRFDQHKSRELAASIEAKGILQPILVRKLSEGGYRIIAGERRWRAARQVGLTEIPVIVKEISESDAFELALIENIQREELSPIEEAEAYQRLLTEHGLKQEELATRVGKERSTIANALRLLRLPDELKSSLVIGDLSVGHAKVLLGLDDTAQMLSVGSQAMARGLSVRETERLVQNLKSPTERRPPLEPSPDLEARARQLERVLQRPCDVRMKTAESGELVIAFGTPALGEQLFDALLEALKPASSLAADARAPSAREVV
jgi:ParB family chromosome partitioning protein